MKSARHIEGLREEEQTEEEEGKVFQTWRCGRRKERDRDSGCVSGEGMFLLLLAAMCVREVHRMHRR